MFYFLHGDNQLLSRQKLSDFIAQAKTNQKEIIQLNGKITSLTEMKQALESQSLFGGEKLVIVENLLSRQKSKEKEAIVKFLQNESFSCNLIVWESKQVDARSLRGFSKGWQILLFKTPAAIFNFLDSLKSGNSKQTLIFLQESIKKDNAEMIFYMLSLRIRQLIIAHDLGKKGLKGAPWQIGKLLNQAKKFSLEQLINIYQKLLEIDNDIKTGVAQMPLGWYLDLLISNL